MYQITIQAPSLLEFAQKLRNAANELEGVYFTDEISALEKSVAENSEHIENILKVVNIKTDHETID